MSWAGAAVGTTSNTYYAKPLPLSSNPTWVGDLTSGGRGWYFLFI